MSKLPGSFDNNVKIFFYSSQQSKALSIPTAIFCLRLSCCLQRLGKPCERAFSLLRPSLCRAKCAAFFLVLKESFGVYSDAVSFVNKLFWFFVMSRGRLNCPLQGFRRPRAAKRWTLARLRKSFHCAICVTQSAPLEPAKAHRPFARSADNQGRVSFDAAPWTSKARKVEKDVRCGASRFPRRNKGKMPKRDWPTGNAAACP